MCNYLRSISVVSCLILSALLLPIGNARAQAVGPKNLHTQITTSSGSVNLLDAVALNASSLLRTVTVPTNGYKNVTLCFQTVRVAHTNVTVTPSCSVDDGVTYNSIASTVIADGLGTSVAYSDVIVSSANVSMCFIYDVNSCNKMRFLFAGASAGANDKVTAQVRVGVSQ